MSSRKSNYAAWLAKADNDLLNIENNLLASTLRTSTEATAHRSRSGQRVTPNASGLADVRQVSAGVRAATGDYLCDSKGAEKEPGM